MQSLEISKGSSNKLLIVNKHMKTFSFSFPEYPDRQCNRLADPLPPGPSKTNSNKSSKQKERNKRKKEIYYRTIYNKHLRTDKIVQQILRKYHNLRIPKLSKAYCNTTKLHTMLLTNKSLHNKLSLHTTST